MAEVHTDAAAETPAISNAYRTYELLSTRPLPTLEIPVTLTLRFLGPKANERIVEWYTAHRAVVAWFAFTAKIFALIAWFTPWREAAIVPISICCFPKMFCTLMLLSVPILQLLIREYEFWFASVLNVVGTILFASQLESSLDRGYALLSCLTIQVTVLSDADVYTLSETARTGVLSSAYTVAVGFFALHKSKSMQSVPSSSRSWQQAQLNLLANVALTLAVFVINKSYKRRCVFQPSNKPCIPLAVCRAQLSNRRREPRSQQLVNQLSVISPRDPNPASGSTTIVDGIATRRRSSVLSSARYAFRVRPQAFRFVDSRATLLPHMCSVRKLSRPHYLALTSCGVMGLCLAGIALFLIVLLDVRERLVLYPCAVLSLILTAAFCSVHAAHYQRDIFLLLVRNFDFWFLSMQFISATVCLADLLQWDYRCLCIISWSFWFHWVLLTDAMLTIHARKLHFKKLHATPVLLAVLCGILVLTYSLAIDKRDILEDRAMKISSLRGAFTLNITTGTFMAYRLATIWLWTVRLVSRLAKYPEEKLIFLRGAVEYRNPFFTGVAQPSTIATNAK